MWYSFADELEKIASVPGAKKMYRRAVQMLTSGEHAFHGVEGGAAVAGHKLQKILESGMLKPSVGAHGKGVYLWKERPLQTYLHRPGEVGLAVPLSAAKSGSKEVARKVTQDPYRPHMLVREGELPLPPKDTFVIAPKDVLAKNQKEIAQKGYKQMDAAIFHRAEADLRAKGHARAGRGELYPEEIPTPGVKTLTRSPPQEFGKLRAAVPKAIEDFMSSFARKVGVTA